MKRHVFFLLLLLFFFRVAFGMQVDLIPLNRTANSVPLQTSEKIAMLKVAHKWDVKSFAEPIPMSDPVGNLNAYMFCFSFSDANFPSFQHLIQPADVPISDVWHTGEYGYIIVSAVKTMPPVLDIADCLPPYYATLSRTFQKAKQMLLGNEPKLVRIFFLSTSSIWFEFANESGCVYVNGYQPEIVATQEQWNKDFANWIVPDRIFPSWANFDGMFGKEAFNVVDYGHIDGVPAYLWSFGCAPTSSAMVFGYWDTRGYGMLIDYFYDHYDVVLHTTVSDVPNVQRELAIAMNTDTASTGGTYPVDMPPAHEYVANDLNGYEFSSDISPDGAPSNHYNWSWITDEIDLGRPFVWGVLNYYYPGMGYIGHATTGIGYETDVSGDSLVILRNTWDYGEHSWALYTTEGGGSWDNVITVVPGGGTGVSINLLTPIDGESYSAGSAMEITWETEGTGVDHIMIEYTDTNCSVWNEIVHSAPDDGSYNWTIPDSPVSEIIKIRIKAYSSTDEQLAGDASGNIVILATSNVSCEGYFPVGMPYTEHSDVMVANDYVFTADYTNGIGEIDISDINAPLEVARTFDTHGDAVALWVQDSLVYVASFSASTGGGLVILNTNAIYDTVEPYNAFLPELSWFTDVRKTMDVQVQGDYAYLIESDWGLRVVDVSDPTTPHTAGIWSEYSPNSYQGLFIDGDYAYVASGYNGIKVLDISSLDDITEIGSYDTDGYSVSCFAQGNRLYVADGWFGDMLILDISDPSFPTLLGSYNTDGYVHDVKSNNIRAFVADLDKGFLCLDVTDPTSITLEGYFQTRGNAQAVDFKDTFAFVAARYDGLYILNFSTISSINEPFPSTPSNIITHIHLFPNPFNSSQEIVLKDIAQDDKIVSLDIFDLSGKHIRKFSNEYKRNRSEKNSIIVHWNGCDDSGNSVPAGIYLVNLTTAKGKFIAKSLSLK